jgi:hypothetical protein
MKTAIAIVKDILLPKLEKDFGFDSNKINAYFLETFATALLDFETDAQPLYAAIYSLELADAEKIISKLGGVYSNFLKELAESYVLGQSSEAIAYLLKTNNAAFLKEVVFLQKMQQAIKGVERKRIKADLPKSYERLTFELSEKDIANVAKKKGREDLREKMKQWDEEMIESEPVLMEASFSHNIINDSPKEYKIKRTESKVVFLSWIKYAVAACLVLGLGLLFYTNQSENEIPSDTIVTAPDKESKLKKSVEVLEVEALALAEVAISAKAVIVMEESGQGFAATTKKIRVIEIIHGERILSIQKAIVRYQKTLDAELVAQKSVSVSNAKELENRISSLQKELSKMKEIEKQYIFDGQKLTLFISTPSKENRVLLYEDNYYLIKDKDFYELSISKQPQYYKKETDSNVLKALDKIIFDNE